MKSTLQIVAVTILAVMGAIGYHAFQADQDARAEAATAAWRDVQKAGAEAIHSTAQDAERQRMQIHSLQNDARKARTAELDSQAEDIQATARIAARTKRIQHATDCENAITGGLELPASCK